MIWIKKQHTRKGIRVAEMLAAGVEQQTGRQRDETLWVIVVAAVVVVAARVIVDALGVRPRHRVSVDV